MSCSFQGCNNIDIYVSIRRRPNTPWYSKKEPNHHTTTRIRPWQKTCGNIPEPNCYWSPIPISGMRHTIPRRDASNGRARLPGFGLGKLFPILSFTCYIPLNTPASSRGSWQMNPLKIREFIGVRCVLCSPPIPHLWNTPLVVQHPRWQDPRHSFRSTAFEPERQQASALATGPEFSGGKLDPWKFCQLEHL